MKITLKSLAITLTAVTLVGCNRGTIDSNLLAADESGNNNIYRDYRVDYAEDSGESMASASLSVGGSWGTMVKIVGPSSLTINGSEASERSDEFDGGEVAAFYAGFLFPPAWLFLTTTGPTYHKTMSGNPAQVSFSWTDNGGENFLDAVSIPDLQTSVPASGARSGFTVSVSGEVTDAKTTVMLTQDGISKRVYDRSKTVEISASDLSEFSVGPVDVHVEVEFSQRIAKDSRSLGGKISTAYTFSSRTISLN